MRDGSLASKLSVIIPKFGDARMRYRFVCEPLRDCGVDTITPDMWSFYGLLRDMRRGKQTRVPVTVLIGCGIKPLFVACVAQLSSSTVVLRLGGDPFNDARTLLGSSRQRWRFGGILRAAILFLSSSVLLRICHDVIVVNGALARSLASRCPPTTQFHVIPQGISGDAEVHAGSSHATVSLLTVANLRYPQKAEGVIWLLEQLRRLALDGSRCFIFRIAGAGEGKALLDHYLANNELPRNLTVELLGFVTDVAYEYRRANVFVYKSEYDATPNVLLEAKRFGLPVLVNDYEPLKEVVRDGVSGIVYADAGDFDAGLLRLCSDPELCSRLAEGGRVELREVYSTTAVGTALKLLLDDVSNRDSCHGGTQV